MKISKSKYFKNKGNLHQLKVSKNPSILMLNSFVFVKRLNTPNKKVKANNNCCIIFY